MKWYNWLFLVFRLIVHIPGAVFGYLCILMLLPWACRAPRFEKYGVLTAVWRDSITKWWIWSTTISRGIVYQPDHRREHKSDPMLPVERHEAVHVRQSEDLTFLALLIGLVVGICTGNWWLAAILWFSGPAWQLPNFIMALRFLKKRPVGVGLLRHICVSCMYYESEHERSARGQTMWGDYEGYY